MYSAIMCKNLCIQKKEEKYIIAKKTIEKTYQLMYIYTFVVFFLTVFKSFTGQEMISLI